MRLAGAWLCLIIALVLYVVADDEYSERVVGMFLAMLFAAIALFLFILEATDAF